MKMRYSRQYASKGKAYRGLDWPLVKRLMAYLMPYRKFLVFSIVLLVFAKGIEAFVPIYIGEVVQRILDNSSSGEAEKIRILESVFLHCGVIGILLLVAYLLDTVNAFLKNWIGQKGLFSLRMDVYRHIQKMPVDYFNKTPVGTLMTRTIHDVDQINQMFSESVVPLTGSLILFLCICIGLMILDLRAAVVLFAILPFVVWLTNYFRVHQRRCYDMIRGIVAAMNAFVQEHLMGAATIRTFGLHKEEKRQFDAINRDHRNANVETIHYFAFFFAGIDFAQSLALITIFVALAAFTGIGERFDAGTYFAFSLYILMLFRPLADLAERYNLLQSAIAAADRVVGVLDQKTEEEQNVGKNPLETIERIEFQSVWFAYKDENWVLKGITFAIGKGESVALVGLTGAGKTTILNLLMRFRDPQRGQILINGKDIKDYPLHALRRQFSVVLQDPEIFSGTIENNISLGEPIEQARIEEAVDYVNLRPLIDTLSGGLQYELQERGKSLSAGQRQLVSLARAVAHDSSVLLLDEATANIDSRTEKTIQDVLGRILADKTSLVIAHRLSTIKDVDKIIVLHQGLVQEEGTHQQLLESKGVYEKLYRLQFMNKHEDKS